MPLYDYDCAACGRRIEVIHGVHAPGPTHCPNCGAGPLRKAISAPAVHFKGSGWAKKERRATVAPGTAKGGDSSSGGDGEGKSADGEGKSTDGEGKRADGEGKGTDGDGKGGRTSTGSSADKGDDRSDTDQSPTAPSKTAGAGTATKTD